MKEIIIVGAGGFGRELLQWIKEINYKKQTWKIKGFLDDNLHALDGYNCDYRIIGRISEWHPSANEIFALAIAKIETKKLVVDLITSRGGKFASIIHPTTRICDFAKYGKGLIMYPGSSIGPNCIIGNYVTLLSSGLGHDVIVGDFSTISSLCGISGHVKIGNSVYLGTGCIIPPSLRIGDNAFVGMGSVIIRNVKDNTKVFGNPAKVIDI